MLILSNFSILCLLDSLVLHDAIPVVAAKNWLTICCALEMFNNKKTKQ